MIIFDLGGVLLHEAEVTITRDHFSDTNIELINGKPPRIFNLSGSNSPRLAS